jgi:hypothetical protein
MPEKIQRKGKGKDQVPQLKTNDSEAPSKMMAPPPFQLKAEPIQREEDGSQQGVQPLAPTMPNFQLSPDFFNLQGEDDFAFMQRLRRRMPGVGGLLSDDATLGLWQVDPLAAPFEDQDGNARRNADGSPMTQWSQLGGQDLDDQMRISRMIADRRHLNLGWDGPLNGQGLGASHQWEDGRSLSMGLMPTFNKDSTAPLGLDGVKLGLDYRF